MCEEKNKTLQDVSGSSMGFFFFFFFPSITSTKEVMFSPMSVCLYLSWLGHLSAELHKNYWMDFYKTRMEDGFKIHPFNF